MTNPLWQEFFEATLDALEILDETGQPMDASTVACRLLGLSHEDQLWVALDAACISIWDWDIRAGRIAWSHHIEPTAASASGMKEVSYESLLAHVYWGDREMVHHGIQAALQQDSRFNLEFRVHRTEDELRWVSSQARVFCDTEGAPIRMIAVEWDITKYKQAEAKLHRINLSLEQCKVERTKALEQVNEELRREIRDRQQAEHYLETFFSQSLDGCFFCLLDTPCQWDETVDKAVVAQKILANLRLTKVNATMLAYYGATPAEMLNRHLQDFFQHDVKQEHLSLIRQLLDQGQMEKVETRERRLDGSKIWIEGNYSCLYDEAGRVKGFFGIQRDITSRKQAEAQIQAREQRFQALLQNATDIIVILDAAGVFTYASPSAIRILGYEPEQVVGQLAFNFVHPDDQQAIAQVLAQSLQQPGVNQPLIEYRVQNAQGGWILFEAITTNLLHDPAVQGIVVNCHDVTARKQAETVLQLEAEREQILGAIAQRIRQSLQLEETLNTTVREIQQLLSADQVLIVHSAPAGQYEVVAEAAIADWPTALGWTSTVKPSTALTASSHLMQQHGISPDLPNTDQPGEQIHHLQPSDVEAQLVVPILQSEETASDEPWGWLIIRQGGNTRQWQAWEVNLLQRLATQVAIAIQQAELHQQVQQLNTTLEQQVQDRTAQLQKALELEARLKRITDAVRDSLDEHQILQTAVQELALGLDVICCDSGIYSADHTTSIIRYEYFPDAELARLGSAKDQICSLTAPYNFHLYQALLQGQHCQFCFTGGNPIRPIQAAKTILACPIFDNQGVLGDLWLFRPAQTTFSELEVRLVQQVANQCAIAIRQARLYQAAQAQVEQLERLNQMKDDFLSTVSHELRTPISNMKMSGRMLELAFKRLDLSESEAEIIRRYLGILREECDREIRLIDDLLNLQSSESESELAIQSIDLNSWLADLLAPFAASTQRLNQQFQVHLPSDPPPVFSNALRLQRILHELLNNAVKYTPAGEQIQVSVQTTEPPEGYIEFVVRNSGAEIAAAELPYIFDKFYRVPNRDRWKHGGTGLGLALVKKLVNQLQGTVQVMSDRHWTTFVVRLPHTYANPEDG